MDLKRPLTVALLIGSSALVGCKTPSMGSLAFWKSDDASPASSSPDVSKQKYEGLAKEFPNAGARRGGTVAQASALGGPPPVEEEGNFFTKSWNKTSATVASAFTFKKEAETEDPTSLTSPTGKVGAEVYVAAGRMLESQGKFPEAQEKYEQAVKVSPSNVTALVSLARLHDRQNRGPQAIELYQKALKTSSKNSLVLNDLGLCYAKQKQFAKAAEALREAVALQPTSAKYRNNLAAVLVEMGRSPEALEHLAAVNPPAVAQYNLGYLLVQQGQKDLAAKHLQQAIDLDPNLGQARDMLAQVSPAANSPLSEQRIAARPVSTPTVTPPIVQLPTTPAAPTKSSTFHIGDDVPEEAAPSDATRSAYFEPGEDIQLLPPVELK